MTTFAHLAPGPTEVLDPRAYPTVTAYKASFAGVAETTWASHTFKEVPDGTVHGAADGTWVPPPPPAPQPKILRADEVLGLLPAAVVKSIRDSTSAAVIKRYECFKIKPTWTKAEGIALFNDIEGAALMTNQQNLDALALWPTA